MKQMSVLRVVAASTILIAGCAHQERVTRYETTQGGPAYAETVTMESPQTYDRTVVNSPTANTITTAPADTAVVTPIGNTVSTTTTDTTVVTTPPVPSTQNELSYTDIHPNIVSPVPPPATRASRTAGVIESTTTTTPADTVVVEQVRRAMNNDPTLVTIVPDVQVVAVNGTVTLTGNVANQDQRQRIEYLTKGITGVVTLNDQLQVPVSPTGRVSQQTLIYSNAPGVASTQGGAGTPPRLYSSSTDSTAISNQSAPPDTAVAAALEASHSASSITNNQDLSVQPPKSSILSATTPSITETNTTSVLPDSSAVTSSSSFNSTNTSGVGPTEPKDLTPTSDRGSASRVYSTNQSSNPSSQSGASPDSSQKVDLRGTTDSDKQIGAQMVQQLKNDASTASLVPALRISIENGKAMLRGSVKSDEEKSKVEAIARQIPGVTSVENQLAVGANGTSQINESK